ncbi:D-aminoacyl-tRNA deacylase [Clostridium sp. HCP1S3_B4]|uniref:D-aminoacyl-tRNA deacylase n=1 Tax=unclassified Clostridium TaxID=2614128 RepID=UPI0016977F40|nr:D-aminoacyl-tRNA deacylase [Clostridiales bacterium]MDY2729207.1 D-aminoacyl-tRNA deacylase [Clostridium sp.]NLK24650.1 D-tyrosyl-tRNA(Tyr) deacylase [Clostridiales bacterium]
MRALIQRVSSSKVVVSGKVVGSIGRGFNVLIGIAKDDTLEDVLYIKDKILNLRIFEDENEKMNLSLKDIKGEILAISQFTLYGDCRKGRRPNFMNAMAGEDAKKLYDELVLELKKSNLKVETGIFGADMKVDIQNDGPVTILIESKN